MNDDITALRTPTWVPNVSIIALEIVDGDYDLTREWYAHSLRSRRLIRVGAKLLEGVFKFNSSELELGFLLLSAFKLVARITTPSEHHPLRRPTALPSSPPSSLSRVNFGHRLCLVGDRAVLPLISTFRTSRSICLSLRFSSYDRHAYSGRWRRMFRSVPPPSGATHCIG